MNRTVVTGVDHESVTPLECDFCPQNVGFPVRLPVTVPVCAPIL